MLVFVCSKNCACGKIVWNTKREKRYGDRIKWQGAGY